MGNAVREGTVVEVARIFFEVVSDANEARYRRSRQSADTPRDVFTVKIRTGDEVIANLNTIDKLERFLRALRSGDAVLTFDMCMDDRPLHGAGGNNYRGLIGEVDAKATSRGFTIHMRYQISAGDAS